MPTIDPTVLGHLYRCHASALRLYARQWGSAAEDFVQNAFVHLARQQPPPDRPLPWLYRVVRNEALAARRSAMRRQQREELCSTPEAWFDATGERIDAAELARGLAELPLEFREVIVARLWGGLTFEEVAELVGCSLPTAHRRYETGLARLSEKVQDPCNRTQKT
jgi:RNA polymerase sigma-70 factor (ECF subfamily)